MTQTFWVAVKWIIKNPEGKYLVIYKSDLEDVGPNDFDLPGWRIGRWEKLEEALHREILEEVWLTVRIQNVVNAREVIQHDLHFVGISFLVVCDGVQQVKLSDEHTGYRRKTKEEILDGEFPEWIKKEFQKI